MYLIESEFLIVGNEHETFRAFGPFGALRPSRAFQHFGPRSFSRASVPLGPFWALVNF